MISHTHIDHIDVYIIDKNISNVLMNSDVVDFNHVVEISKS